MSIEGLQNFFGGAFCSWTAWKGQFIGRKHITHPEKDVCQLADPKWTIEKMDTLSGWLILFQEGIGKIVFTNSNNSMYDPCIAKAFVMQFDNLSI